MAKKKKEKRKTGKQLYPDVTLAPGIAEVKKGARVRSAHGKNQGEVLTAIPGNKEALVSWDEGGKDTVPFALLEIV